MRPFHVVLISHAIPCSTGSMHSSHVILINRTTKFLTLAFTLPRSSGPMQRYARAGCGTGRRGPRSAAGEVTSYLSPFYYSTIQ